MSTVPPGTSLEHTNKLKEIVGEYVEEARAFQFKYYNIRNVARVFGVEFLSPADIVNEVVFQKQLDELIKNGTQWINISGDGFAISGFFLCSFDFSKDMKCEKSLIELSGPQVSASGEIKFCSDILVGVLDEVAAGFLERGLKSQAEYIKSKYRMRAMGDWGDDLLPDFSGKDLILFKDECCKISGKLEIKEETQLFKSMLSIHEGNIRRVVDNISKDSRLASQD